MRLPEKNRLEAFSDGVFAIIITLLVLEIGVPHIADPNTQELFVALNELLPKFIAFAISFIIIAVYWVSHHDIFSELKLVSGKILWINLLALFLISLLPFTTALIGDYYSTQGAVFIYSIHIFLIGIIFAGLERIILRSRDLLLRPDCPTYSFKRNLFGIALNFLACIMAFIWIPGTYILLIASRLIFIIYQLKIKNSKKTAYNTGNRCTTL